VSVDIRPSQDLTTDSRLPSLAYHEVSSILAKMIYHFDMEPGMKNMDDWIKQKCFVVWKKSPLMVKLTARDVM
jgi:hypothetical protein